jgi:O-6-methylguanine DNA methyltransferase
MKQAVHFKKNASAARKFKELNFSNKVLAVVKKIPASKVLSYQQVAEKAGKPKAYRAVGNILNKNRNPKIPCHRVVRSDGKLGGYNRGIRLKEELLKQERTQNNHSSMLCKPKNF